MRIRKHQLTRIRSRRKFGFHPCGISILCNASCCRRWRRYCWKRKIEVVIVILIGIVVINTLMIITPSQQYLTVYWETSLLNVYTKGTGTTTTIPSLRNGPNESSTNVKPNTMIEIKWNHWKDMERIVDSIWGGSRFCTTVKEKMDHYYNESKAIYNNHTGMYVPSPQIPVPNIYVHLEFSCSDLYKHSKHGTGNYIQAIYYMRLAVKYIPNVKLKLNITCLENDSPEFYSNYILPWFTGVWYTPTSTMSRVMERIRILVHTQRYKSYRRAMEYENYCGRFKVNPTAIMYREMQYDVRRMAIALVGTQPFINDDDEDATQQNHRKPIRKEIQKFLHDNIYEVPSLEIDLYNTYIRNTNNNNINRNTIQSIHNNITLKPGTQQRRINDQTTNIVPLIPLQSPNPDNNILLDDAVIHFRCGDLLSTDLLAYGFLTFHGYSRHISSSVQSIGILTQPFGKIKNSTDATIGQLHANVTEQGRQRAVTSDQERLLDTGNETISRRCRTLVYAFQDYLQDNFPKAKVHIRNDRTETIALAYVRMVMAKQVVGSMSTFSIYPIIGTFGTGYYLRPKLNDPSYWAENNIYPVTKIWDIRTVIFDEDAKLLGTKTRDLWDAYGDDVVLQWFRTGNYTLPMNSTVST